jgi:CRISPR-associated exonuclease Cas4
VDSGEDETRGDTHVVRGLNIYSHNLGISGKADVVEFRNERGELLPYPVEYKVGKPKLDACDTVQLCAQALCLEEMLSGVIDEAALFYGKTRHRLRIELTAELRGKTLDIINAVHAMITSGEVPPARYEKKCESCSLYDACMPGPASAESATILKGCLNVMKKHLNTLFITSADAYIRKEGETFVVEVDDKKALQAPVHTIENIVCFGFKPVTPALMAYCAENSIGISYLSPSGRFLARVYGAQKGNVILRKRQYSISDSPEGSLAVARNITASKIANSRISFNVICAITMWIRRARILNSALTRWPAAWGKSNGRWILTNCADTRESPPTSILDVLIR